MIVALALGVLSAGASAISTRMLSEETIGSRSSAVTPAQDRLNRGIEALQRGDLDPAVVAFNESAKLDPKSYLPLLGLAEVALRRNQPAEAEKRVQQALRLTPSNAEVLTAAGRVAFVSRKIAASEHYLKKAVAADATFFSAHLDLGDLYLDTLRKPREAIENYRAAVKINPKHAGAHHGLGRALAAAGDTTGALAEFDNAARLAPDILLPRQATGEIQLALAQHDKALSTFDEILKIKADFIPALTGKGEAYFAKGDTDNAITAFRKVTAAEPKHALAHMRLGMLYQQQRRWDDAQTAYLAAVSADKNLAIAYNNLAWMAAERGVALGKALDWAKLAVKLDPSQPAFLDTLAWVYRSRKELDQSLATLDKAAKMKPQIPTVHVHRGMVYEDKNRRKQALEAYREAVKLGPQTPEVEHARKRIEVLSTEPAR